MTVFRKLFLYKRKNFQAKIQDAFFRIEVLNSKKFFSNEKN